MLHELNRTTCHSIRAIRDEIAQRQSFKRRKRNPPNPEEYFNELKASRIYQRRHSNFTMTKSIDLQTRRRIQRPRPYAHAIHKPSYTTTLQSHNSTSKSFSIYQYIHNILHDVTTAKSAPNKTNLDPSSSNSSQVPVRGAAPNSGPKQSERRMHDSYLL